MPELPPLGIPYPAPGVIPDGPDGFLKLAQFISPYLERTVVSTAPITTFASGVSANTPIPRASLVGGFVQLDGQLNVPNISTTAVPLCTIPDGYRPVDLKTFVAAGNQGASVRLLIAVSGEVSATIVGGTTNRIFLDSVRFRIG